MIREMKTLLSVAQLGTFVAAGNRVGLTQSAVSAQMRSLEQAVGTPLFERTGRTATLNAAGQRAVRMATEILQIYERLCTPEQPDGYHGSLTLGAIASAQTGMLPAALVHLRETAPQVQTKLVPGVSLNLLSAVDAGELDLAIMIRPPFAVPKELRVELLAQEPFVLICPLDLPGDDPLQLLRDQPLVRYDRHSFGGRLVSNFLREQRIEARAGLELDELDAIVRMVAAGLGVSLIPRAGLWLQQPARVRVLELGPLTFHRELVLVLRHAQHRQPLIQLFRQCLGGTGETADQIGGDALTTRRHSPS
ncbi:LysR family transcriptional regulator [Pseudomonas sp. HR96]|uniref:LysR family transcriptional regulator n=1 Tax=Pseudomonas sp. HR96 TaxID=1027966 RepID=UPI002A75681E|nr:LysR family transcriptional regulator [Pseudomonas sp. HR96]WPO98199.1 LysR family transcriptional regulator [Pseudomonas sp. HR96]